jgi:hypothetical protein
MGALAAGVLSTGGAARAREGDAAIAAAASPAVGTGKPGAGGVHDMGGTEATDAGAIDLVTPPYQQWEIQVRGFGR